MEILNFCKSYYSNTISNDRITLNGKEIDVLIPEINLGIEFNGIYWHSELNGKDRDYHLNKTILAKSKGIQLIHIFEDEWIDKRPIVESMLRAKMSTLENRLYARKCVVSTVTSSEAISFLNNNH